MTRRVTRIVLTDHGARRPRTRPCLIYGAASNDTRSMFHRAMRRQRAAAWGLVLVALAVHPANSQTPKDSALVSHDFSESAQGWQIVGDSATVDPIFTRSGGHPGGCITGIDEALGETWYFRAPMTVVRHLPAAVNGTLSYSLKQSGSQVSLFDDDVVIVGPAGRLSYRFQRAPGTDWTDFSVRLSESDGWTWNWNRRATQSQIDSVLAGATRLDIRGEYVSGPDEGSLDNVVLRGVVLPGVVLPGVVFRDPR